MTASVPGARVRAATPTALTVLSLLAARAASACPACAAREDDSGVALFFVYAAMVAAPFVAAAVVIRVVRRMNPAHPTREDAI